MESNNKIFSLRKGLTVLSLCDDMSCGHIALDRAGCKVNKYFVAEIKDIGIKITKDNYPDTIHVGDVIDVETAFSKVRWLYCGVYKGYRILYGGMKEGGKIVVCKYLLRSSDMFRKYTFKNIEVVDNMKEYAQKKKHAFIKSIEERRRTIEECRYFRGSE